MRWGTDDSSSPSLARPSKDSLEPRQADRRAAERLLTRPRQGYNVRPLPLLGLVAGAVLGTLVAAHALSRDASDEAEKTNSSASSPSSAAPAPTIWVDLEEEPAP